MSLIKSLYNLSHMEYNYYKYVKINIFREISAAVAFLKLGYFKGYTRHCLRRPLATLLTVSGTHLTIK